MTRPSYTAAERAWIAEAAAQILARRADGPLRFPLPARAADGQLPPVLSPPDIGAASDPGLGGQSGPVVG